MRKIVYYVATSIDGFICGPQEDVTGFVGEGNGVEKYLSDLKSFDTVIMGRKTYEFGYKFGLKPGDLPYPHMNHFIFSSSLKVPHRDDGLHIAPLELRIIDDLVNGKGSDIYLCGGGELAGWLLDNERIDVLKVKVNPLLLGAGVRLFGSSSKKYILDLVESGSYDNGLQINTYNIRY